MVFVIDFASLYDYTISGEKVIKKRSRYGDII